jgi:hypothetical protein
MVVEKQRDGASIPIRMITRRLGKNVRGFRTDEFLVDLSRLADQGKVRERIIPLKDSVDIAGEIWVESQTAERVRNGRPLRFSDLPEGKRGLLRKGQRVGLLHGAEKLLAIAESQVDGEPAQSEGLPALRILRVFHD